VVASGETEIIKRTEKTLSSKEMLENRRSYERDGHPTSHPLGWLVFVNNPRNYDEHLARAGRGWTSCVTALLEGGAAG
jgi:hypothetical protein